ncbi:MAG: hypothetical protein AB7F75_05790 [Planctomycetota bacterium]
MGRKQIQLAASVVIVLCVVLVLAARFKRDGVRFNSDTYVTFHEGVFEAPDLHQAVEGLPEQVFCEVVSIDRGDSATGFQIILRDGSSLNQTIRPSDEGETVLLIGRRGYLRVKALEWLGQVRDAGTVRGVKLQFDYKLPPEAYPQK